VTDGPVFREIIAIIRPERWAATKARLERFPVVYSQHRVLGRVRERGLCYLPRNGARPVGIRYLPQRMICCEVEDVMVDAVLQAILQVNGTGSPGGGRVFVLPIESMIPAFVEPSEAAA
jgi:nitrogen regulatory protein PII